MRERKKRESEEIEKEKEEGQGEKEKKKTSISSLDLKNHTFLKHESPLLDQQTKQKYLHQVIY